MTSEPKQLTKDLEEAVKELAAIPDDQKWTEIELFDLDELRGAALHLACEIELILETTKPEGP